MGTFLNAVCYCIGCWLLGTEYSAALGWAVWFIGISIVNF